MRNQSLNDTWNKSRRRWISEAYCSILAGSGAQITTLALDVNSTLNVKRLPSISMVATCCLQSFDRR